jgi:hypothetical protein
MSGSHLPAGFVMKPAQMTNPARLVGRVAVNFTANGVEKDSASTTNESASGMTSTTQESSADIRIAWDESPVKVGVRLLSHTVSQIGTNALNFSSLPSKDRFRHWLLV